MKDRQPGSLVRPMLLLAAVLVIPVLPFVLAGEQVEAWIRSWFEPPPGDATIAGLVFAALATDVLLPVPSSFLTTLAGYRLGLAPAAAVAWAGMTAGAVVAFAAARRWGRPVVARFCRPADLELVERGAQRSGVVLIVATRAIPVLAEASVLWTGMNGLSWRRFLPALAASNLAIAAGYATVGALAKDTPWLPAALALSLAAPAAVALAVRRYARRPST